MTIVIIPPTLNGTAVEMQNQTEVRCAVQNHTVQCSEKAAYKVYLLSSKVYL